MLRPIHSIALSFLLFLALSAHAQTVISPPPHEIRNAIERLPSEQRGQVRKAIGATQPFVIFLPGVLGSKLEEGKDIIFGDGRPSPKIAYTEGKQIKADLLDEFKGLPVRTSWTNMYSKPVSYMQGITFAEGAQFKIFPYDWRQSNIQSADEFTTFICRHLNEIRTRPVIFIAHSMGGIVLKYWLAVKYHSESCGEEKIDQAVPVRSIKHVVFVGTPHRGAPKALGALLDNYYLIGDRDAAGWKQLLNRAIAKNLNEYGATFPSAYELLPRLSPDCEATWAKHPVIMNVQGEDRPVKNVFLIDLWKNYNWPKGPYVNNPSVREQFLTSNLATYLKNANELTCALAKYEIDKEFKVTRFYGQDVNNTDCSVIVNVTDYHSEYTLDFRPCGGDGTVPAESANEGGKGLPLPGEHLALLSANAFTSFLSELFAQNMRDLDTAYAETTGSSLGPVDLREELNQVIPPNFNPTSDAERTANAITVRTNNAVVQKRDRLRGLRPGTTASRIYEDARTKSKAKAPLARANGYRVAAALQNTNAQRKAWALNNAADISLKQKDFSKAKTLALQALQEADAVQRKHKNLRADMRRLKGLAAWTIAIASKKLGQLADVENYRRLAIQNGNPNARSVKI